MRTCAFAHDVANRKDTPASISLGHPITRAAPLHRRTLTRSGDYLIYWMASQALWRVNPKEGKGLDATFASDWSPPAMNSDNKVLTAGLRFNEPLPLPIHNTMSLGYVRNKLNPQFLAAGAPAPKAEKGC